MKAKFADKGYVKEKDYVDIVTKHILKKINPNHRGYVSFPEARVLLLDGPKHDDPKDKKKVTKGSKSCPATKKSK